MSALWVGVEMSLSVIQRLFIFIVSHSFLTGFPLSSESLRTLMLSLMLSYCRVGEYYFKVCDFCLCCICLTL